MADINVVGLDLTTGRFRSVSPTDTIANSQGQPFVTDWLTIPAGFTGLTGTNIAITGFYRRSGDTGHFRLQGLATGTPDLQNQVGFILPTGWDFDTSKFVSITHTNIGVGHAANAGIANYAANAVAYWTNSPGQVRLMWGSPWASTSLPFTFDTGDSYYAEFCMPIVGW